MMSTTPLPCPHAAASGLKSGGRGSG